MKKISIPLLLVLILAACSQQEHIYKIGVCFDFQKMPGIPADEHDIKMDVII